MAFAENRKLKLGELNGHYKPIPPTRDLWSKNSNATYTQDTAWPTIPRTILIPRIILNPESRRSVPRTGHTVLRNKKVAQTVV